MPPIQRSPALLLDTRRLGAAVGFAGIDPRHWLSIAIVTAIVIDPVEGPFVAITLQPTGSQMSARVGTAYGGSGFGDWCPLRVDDEVLVAIPDGDPTMGPVVIARLWSPADSPPPLMVSNPSDRIIQAIDGQNVWVLATGLGAVNIAAPKVNLGGDTVQATAGTAGLTLSKTGNTAALVGAGVALGAANATQAVPLGTNLVAALTAYAAAVTAAGTLGTTPLQVAALIAAGGTLTTALTDVAAPVLSTVVKTE